LKAAELRAEVEKLTKNVKQQESQLEATNKDLEAHVAKSKLLKDKLTKVTRERNVARKGAGVGSSTSQLFSALGTGDNITSSEARQQLELQQKTIVALRKHVVDLTFQKTKEALETKLPPLPDLRPKSRKVDWLKLSGTSSSSKPPAKTQDDENEIEMKEEKKEKKSDAESEVHFFQKLQTDVLSLNQRALYFRASPKLVDLTTLPRLGDSKHDKSASEEKKDIQTYDKKEGPILSPELQFLRQRQEVENFRQEVKELKQRLHQHLDFKRGPMTSLSVPSPISSLTNFEQIVFPKILAKNIK